MTTADTQRAGRAVPALLLCEMQFASATRRVTTWNHAVSFMGHSWLALGRPVSVSSIAATEALQYPALELGLPVGDSATLALAMGNAHEYRRRPITLWHCVLDDELRPIDEPEVIWAGLMDQVKLKTGDGEQEGGQIVLRCELPGRDGRAAQGLRLNHAQQLQRAPDDYGLSRIERLSAQPQPWLTVRFQRI